MIESPAKAHWIQLAVGRIGRFLKYSSLVLCDLRWMPKSEEGLDRRSCTSVKRPV